MRKRYLLVSLLFSFLSSPFVFSFPKVHADGKVVINEFVTHPRSGNKEWVEFYNPDNVDLSNYWIDDDTSFTDDSNNSNKKSLASLQSGKDAQHPYIELSSSIFNNSGDSVVLFDANGTIVDQYQYSDDPGSDISIGRSPDGNGSLQVLAAATKGDVNTNPQPTVAPTATHTPTPTLTPVPTHTPTPTKVPTPTKIPTPTSIKSISATSGSQNVLAARTSSLTADETVATSTNSNVSNLPTSILGMSTSAATLKISPTKTRAKKEDVLIKGSTSGGNQIQTAVIFISSAVLLLICGILVFWKIKKKNQEA